MKRWFIFCKDSVLLSTDGSTFGIPSGEVPPISLSPWQTPLEIGTMDDTECLAVAIDTPVTDREGLEMCPLRASYYKLSLPLYLMAGKAYELIYWNHNTQFCGICGSPMKRHTAISKHCTGCGKEVWPQVAPAIIVAIHRGDELLMVRARNFRGTFYGLVAGFVETGETLEDCVRREVLEETGLTVKNIRYSASQPWPYPSGLMIGFHADYDGGQLHLQREELAEGGWFHKDHLPQLPEKLSLARTLVDEFLASH